MICPACKSLMIVVEHQKIELDYCPECHGVWFDAGELELFLESFHMGNREQFVSSILDASESKTPEKKRRCPICAQKMKKVAISEKPGILIDVCRRADGLWFDGGEVDELLKQLPEKPSETPPHHQLSAFLREVFKAQE